MISDATIELVDGDLTRLGVPCCVCVKVDRRWTTVAGAVETFRGALANAQRHVEVGHEAAVFIGAGKYRGIMIWTSTEPDVANTFTTYV